MSYFKAKILSAILLTSSMLASAIAQAVIVSPNLEVITVSSVGGTLKTVNLQNTYTNAVPVCTYNLVSNVPVPAVVRIDNIIDSNVQPSDHSFDVYIQAASASSLTAASVNDVHCVISEQGEFTESGLHWEARTKLSTYTGVKGSLVNASDNVTSLVTGSYTDAVVLHQVITSNDPDWSVAWTHNGVQGTAPTASSIYVGKHVASDFLNPTRANETLGFIIIEEGSGSVNGVSYDAALGGVTIDGVDDAGNTYTAPTIDYRHGVASQNGENGGDGGWAVLFGVSPLASSAIDLAIDEDEIDDSERRHANEEVAYWLFEPTNVAELEVTLDDGSVNYTPGSTVVYTAVVTNNGPNDATAVNILNPLPAGTVTMNWTCSGVACPVAAGSGALNQTVASLNNGQALTYSISVDVPDGVSGDLSNSISVDSVVTDFDLLTSNDSVTDVNTNDADIVVTVDDGAGTYTAGTISTYTVTMSNSGPRSADNARITLNAPADSTITSWTCTGASCPAVTTGSGNIDYTVASFADSDSISYSVDVTSFSSRTGDMIVTVNGNADNADPVAGNNSASDTDTPIYSADIIVTNSDGSVAYLPGGTVSYNITVSNNGPSDAANVAITDTTSAGTTISIWSCTGSSCPAVAGTGPISETAATLAASDSISYVVDVNVPFAFVGDLLNTAIANADEPDPDSVNNTVIDTNIASPDTDGDGVPDSIEISDGTDPNNPNDFKDSDGDGVPDLIEMAEGTDPNDPLSILDSDGDGSPDYLERGGDKDGDGIGDEFESSITDTDGNNIKDDLDSDADGDGVPDTTEGLIDTDGDGIPDFLDIVTGGNPLGGDSDGDGVVDATECAVYPYCADTDGDSIPNYADSDDDNDSLLTSFELGAGGGVSPDDSDGDTVFDYLEPNNFDNDADGTFNHLDADDDGDGIATVDELDANGDLTGDALNPDDLDNEGIPDYLDASNGDGSGTDIIGSGDSDGDGMSDADECPAAPMCADSDSDGIPNYMIANTDSDGDGILDAVEIGIDPSNPIDTDADGVPDYLEDNTLDTDADGLLNILDADDDDDGIPTSQELGSGGALNPADSDGDGIPDYLSQTKILTGLDGGAGAISPLYFIAMLLITIIRNRQSTCLVKQQKY